ncbi:MAG: hypothetical protein K6F72_09445 [Bacteroidales bacterium]|nr:hypothetical protein [Bacteroidales bacterium]
MATIHKHKKNLIVSYKNLSDDLKELFKEAYPEGYKNYITKFVKPNGEAIFVVPFETDDTAYMVKFDVKVDTLGEDLDKALFDDDGDDAGEDNEFDTLAETREKEEGVINHREEHLRHGDFEDMLSEDKKKKATLGVDKEGLKEAFADDEEADELDSYDRLDDDEPDEDDDFEPSDDDLRAIDDEFLDAEIPPLDATIPEDEMVQIGKPSKKKASKATTKASPKTATKKAAKPAAKPAVKATAKPAARPAAKATAKPAAKPAAKAVAKPAVKKAVKKK